MPKDDLDELTKSSKRISDNVKSGFGSLVSHRTKTPCCGRNLPSTSRRIVLDPVSFLIGGLGAVAVGSLTDEINDGEHETSNGEIFTASVLRTVKFPIRTAVRFIAGGCIYVIVDSLIINVLNITSSPLISGSVTGLCFAIGARTSLLLGSMLGMAVFSQMTDNILYGMFNGSFYEIRWK